MENAINYDDIDSMYRIYEPAIETGTTKLYKHGVMFDHSNQICNSLKLHPLLLIISCSIVNCTWRLFQLFAKFVNQGSNM